jgi:hypothetical protein
VYQLDPDMAIYNLETMDEHVRAAYVLPRVAAMLFGIFGGIGVVLATVGLYGVMSFAVLAWSRFDSNNRTISRLQTADSRCRQRQNRNRAVGVNESRTVRFADRSDARDGFLVWKGRIAVCAADCSFR